MRAEGVLTHADYTEIMIPRLEAILAEGVKGRVFFEFGPSFDGWEMRAMWDDAKFGMKHRKDFARLAVVGGPGWVEWATRLGAHLVDAELRTFPEDQRAAALDWVRG